MKTSVFWHLLWLNYMLSACDIFFKIWCATISTVPLVSLCHSHSCTCGFTKRLHTSLVSTSSIMTFLYPSLQWTQWQHWQWTGISQCTFSWCLVRLSKTKCLYSRLYRYIYSMYSNSGQLKFVTSDVYNICVQVTWHVAWK